MYEMYFAVSEDKCYEIGDMFEVGKRFEWIHVGHCTTLK